MASSIALETTANLPHYRWAVDAGNISTIPSLRRTNSDLEELVGWTSSGHKNPFTFSFTPLDCETTFGRKNCTEACRNGTSLFTPNNIRMCSMLAAAAVLVKSKSLSFDLSNGTTKQIAEEWQVPDLATFDGAGLLTSVAQCLSRSCTVASGIGLCSGRVLELPGMTINAGSLATMVDVMGHYCDEMSSNINTDIAGPGVVLSYIIQTSLALALYLFVKLFTSWPNRLSSLLGTCRPSARENGKHIQDRLASSRPSAALVSSLAEFHEVQLYFVGSLQLAALVSFSPNNPNTGSSNSNTYSTALLNSVITHFLGVNSVYCVLLCQVALHRRGMHWWYTFFLMTLVFAMALGIAAEGGSRLPPIDALWEKFKGDEPVPACGGNPSPMTYCGLSIIPRAPWQTGRFFAIVGTLAYVGLLVDQIHHTVRTRYQTWYDGFRKRHEAKTNGLIGKAWPWLREIYWLWIQIILVMSVTWYFAVLLDTSSEASIGDTTKWSFGQLIAVVVWAPSIVKYIYYNVFGIEGGFEERIPEDYSILRNKDSAGLPEKGGMKHAATYPLDGPDGRLSA